MIVPPLFRFDFLLMFLIYSIVSLITLCINFYVSAILITSADITLRVPCKKFKMVSFTSLRLLTIHPPSTLFRFPVKLFCCIAFGSTLSACYLLKSIVINV